MDVQQHTPAFPCSDAFLQDLGLNYARFNAETPGSILGLAGIRVNRFNWRSLPLALPTISKI
jgi:hypothetical protein